MRGIERIKANDWKKGKNMYRVEKEILGEIKNGDSTAQGNSISQMGKIFCEAVDGDRKSVV